MSYMKCFTAMVLSLINIVPGYVVTSLEYNKKETTFGVLVQTTNFMSSFCLYIIIGFCIIFVLKHALKMFIGNETKML